MPIQIKKKLKCTWTDIHLFLKICLKVSKFSVTCMLRSQGAGMLRRRSTRSLDHSEFDIANASADYKVDKATAILMFQYSKSMNPPVEKN